eukprot:TRINITY_DN893_c0_g1_i2.p1 TRINITY_DN893_c0_g1~~TRINITY_DN893_c0_g1_i2.p1  ORF type:complete len:331 (-),score=86.69 TRINITY_DN893_c0_g1_i2:50-1042(-)
MTQVVLTRNIEGFPSDQDFELVPVPDQTIGDDQIRIKPLLLSVDPYQRGKFKASEVGQTISNIGVAEVLESTSDNYNVGDLITGFEIPWATEIIVDAVGFGPAVQVEGIRLEEHMHLLSLTGLTAYFGLYDICEPKEGETVLVSGAAGSVGSIVGQLAKIRGCKVVGTCGSDEKCDYLINELKFDAALNYKNYENSAQFKEALAEVLPEGIDNFFDNVGGDVNDAALQLINNFARISICGQISQYNVEKPPLGPRLLGSLIYKNARIEGFAVMRWVQRFKEATVELSKLILEGKLTQREHVLKGIESVPEAFVSLFTGANIGKVFVDLRE